MTTKVATPSGARILKREMRWWLLIQSFLVWAAGGQLFILSEQTDQFFAWTIKPPLTAAFLGACYWSTLFLMFLSAWEPAWARARVAGPATWIFSTLTLLLTLLHLDRFHLDSIFGWVWVAVYISVPLVLGTLLVRQQFLVRQPDPPRGAPLARWLQISLGIQGGVMVALGIAMFIAPVETGKLWPWMLTALTGRAVAAWLIGWGVAILHGLWENSWSRVHNLMIAYTWLGILLLAALVRYPGTPDWGAVNSWLYLLFVVSILAVGALGWWAAHRARPVEDRVSWLQRIQAVTGSGKKAGYDPDPTA
jgi:hypothetical protein